MDLLAKYEVVSLRGLLNTLSILFLSLDEFPFFLYRYLLSNIGAPLKGEWGRTKTAKMRINLN